MLAGKKIFQPFKFGSFSFKNRIALASMTRTRANPDGIVTPFMIDYYTQRAKAASIVLTECAFVDDKNNSYIGAGGMETEDHAASWKNVVKSVHKENSYIIAQLYHAGRSLPKELHGTQPLAPSPIKCGGKTYVKGEFKEYSVPKEMDEKDIEKAIQQFVNSIKIAKKAGFDAVELHGANGYLIDEFLRDGANKRTDRWGGSVENRSRFVLEIIDRASGIFPFDKIAIKLSPYGTFQSMSDSDPKALISHLLKEFKKRGLFYVQFMETDLPPTDQNPAIDHNIVKTHRKEFQNMLITNGFRDVNEGIRRVEEGEADMASFAQMFIANPDLDERLKNGWKLEVAPKEVWYGPGPKGYSDYPRYNQEKTQEKAEKH